MEANKKMVSLISYLEYIVGSTCYNTKSYNYYTGSRGCEFRYPVHVYQKSEGISYKTNYEIKCENPEDLNLIFYSFGANRLYIGKALIDVLNELERRYGIDINKLEEEYQSKQKK